MSSIIDIPEGRTNDYLMHGLFALIAAGTFLLVHWLFTVGLTVLAVAFFLVRSGIEIHPGGRRVRVYKALGKLRFGTWVQVGRDTSLAIRYTNESQVMNSRATSTNVRVRTYDLHFIGYDGASWQFHDFNDYSKARKCAVTMAKEWTLDLTDEVEERKKRAQDNVRTRRR